MGWNSIACVYGIVCVPNNRIYVGSSKSTKRRWQDHKAALRGGTHHAVQLQRCWSKYGEEAFVFVILKKVEDQSTLHQSEQEYLDLFRHLLLNSYPFACGNAGYVQTREERQRLSLARKGKPKSESHRRAMAEARLGAKSHRSKLSEVQALMILQRADQGERGSDIAKDFGLTKSAISSLLLRKT